MVAIPLPPLPLPPAWLLFLARRSIDSLKSRRSRLVGPGTCSIRIHKTRSIPLAVFLPAVLSSCGDFRMRVVGVSWYALLAYVRFSGLIVEAVV